MMNFKVSIPMMNLPTPSFISLMWNFGSLLMFFMFFQMITGWFLSIHYIADYNLAFFSYMKISHDIFMGWFIQMFHMNFASLIFLNIFFHILKSLMISSFKKINVWLSGMVMYFMIMISAFMGYVLPWGQMSFWGATVITNIFSAIPYFGKNMVFLLWGNFFVGGETLNRFFSFHFTVPLLMILFIFFHIILIHNFGSSNQIGMLSNKDKIMFGKNFYLKDFMGIFFFMFIYFFIIYMFISPHYYLAKENFIEVDPLNTPSHIKPEWYFMFAYSMLRCIPSKIGGIIFLVLIFFSIIFLFLKKKNYFYKFNFLKKVIMSLMILTFFFLIIMGYKEIEEPFILLTKIFSFLFLLLIMLI